MTHCSKELLIFKLAQAEILNRLFSLSLTFSRTETKYVLLVFARFSDSKRCCWIRLITFSCLPFLFSVANGTCSSRAIRALAIHLQPFLFTNRSIPKHHWTSYTFLIFKSKNRFHLTSRTRTQILDMSMAGCNYCMYPECSFSYLCNKILTENTTR